MRIRVAGGPAYITIKGEFSGASRAEFEYDVPLEDAKQLLKLCDARKLKNIVAKLVVRAMVWEVDEFLGANQGLVVAEIELESESQAFAKPDWVGGSHDGCALLQLESFHESLFCRVACELIINYRVQSWYSLIMRLGKVYLITKNLKNNKLRCWAGLKSKGLCLSLTDNLWRFF